MRFNKLFALFVLFFALTSTAACSKVEQGQIGLLAKTTGSKVQKASDIKVVRGRVFYNPITHDLFTYPTTQQTVIWTAAEDEGSPTNESLTFTTGGDGAPINIDVSLSFAVTTERVAAMFLKYRKTMPEYTQTVMKNRVRGALTKAAANFKAQDVVGARRGEFQTSVIAILNRDLAAEGIVFDMFEIVNSPRLPPNVQTAINTALEATQKAQIAENQLRIVQAEAQKRIVGARGEAEARLIEARARSERQVIEAKAEGEANRLKQSTLTPLILQQQAIQKWNGVYPQTVAGSNIPLIRIQ